MVKHTIQIFCDFDGTISKGDVGDIFFTKFSDGKVEADIKLWETGVIDSKELFLRELEKITVTKNEFDEFIRQQSIDPFFKPFVAFCNKHNIPVSILSDGMDLYIHPILQRNQLDHLSVYSNKLCWDGEGKLQASFPYYDFTCGHCANCKGYQLRRLRKEHDQIVFIGDGYSDICGVPEADTLFAKDTLERYCKDHSVSYIPFYNFFDILYWLKQTI